LYERSLVIFEEAFGKNHPMVGLSLNNLALLYAGKGDFQKAHGLFKRAQILDTKLIDQVMSFTNQDQKMKFLAKERRHLYAFMSFVDQYLRSDSSAKRDLLDVWLKRKGNILEVQRRYQEALFYSDEPEAGKTFQELARIRALLSELAFGTWGKDEVENPKKRMTELRKKKEKLEAKLSRLSYTFSTHKKIAKADSERIARGLPENTVLLEFAKFEMCDFKARTAQERWMPAHYIVFVLHAGQGDKVGMIDLGDAETIDRVIAEFKKLISKTEDIKGVKAVQSSRRLYDLVFTGIIEEIGNVKEIFISPDGNLNLIPFEVLQGPDGRFLIEDYTFNYLSAGRDVLRFGESKEKGENALLMGNPDFNMGVDERDATLRRLALTDEKEQVTAKRSPDMRGFKFTRLPGTEEEVRSIYALLGDDQAELYTGKEALEEVLYSRGSPSVLHLATHGFFLPDIELANPAPESWERGVISSSFIQQAPGQKIKIENPLLRSGIALAGANLSLQTENANTQDGILTAEKILGLRLRGTEMVVLSACDTGLGEVKSGEGVFGLRRAFTQAGAKSLVMSMWSVPDKETKEMMIEFYKNLQSGKMNRCQALRMAALKEMRIVKERYGAKNPLFWGAFVFMGEP
jgi:CHAT domain-containing protein